VASVWWGSVGGEMKRLRHEGISVNEKGKREVLGCGRLAKRKRNLGRDRRRVKKKKKETEKKGQLQ